LPDTAASVAAARAVWPDELSWVLVVDGPGQLPGFEPPAETLLVRRAARGGPATARNTGLPSSWGDWLLPLDADDLIDCEALPRLADKLASVSPDTAALAASPRFLDGSWTVHRITTQKLWRPRELEENWTSPFAFHPNCVLINTASLRAVGGWPATGVNEDLALMLWLNRASTILAVPDPLIRYRVSDEQMTASSWYPEARGRRSPSSQVASTPSAPSVDSRLSSPHQLPAVATRANQPRAPDSNRTHRRAKPSRSAPSTDYSEEA
jgi:hypothetical protein